MEQDSVYKSDLFIKAAESDDDRYAPLPLILIEDEAFADMNPTSLIVYAELKNRLFLSRMNDWKDEYGNAVIIFSQESMSEHIHKSVETVKRAYKELREHHLISIRRRGKNKPAYIYMTRPSMAKFLLKAESVKNDTLSRVVKNDTLDGGESVKNDTSSSVEVSEMTPSLIERKQSNSSKQNIMEKTHTKNTPKLEEVIQYADEKGKSRDAAQEFFYYWDSMNWTRKNGRKIQKWKSAFAQWMLNDKRRGGGWNRVQAKKPGEYDEDFFDNLLKQDEERVLGRGRKE